MPFMSLPESRRAIYYYCAVVPSDAAPHAASTVLVLRDSPAGPEVFMVRRHEGTAFMGGAHVFPGGRVDVPDRDADDSWCDGIPHATRQLAGMDATEAVSYHVAAARELFEEAGVLLARDAGGRFVSLAGADDHARFKRYRTDVHSGTLTLRAVLKREGLRLALDTLLHFAHWVTPPLDTRRFDTRFFLTRVPPHQTPAHDETETTHSAWVTASGAIADAIANEIVLPPPTWSTVREIEPFRSVAEALEWARGRQVVRREPKVLDHNGQRMLVVPGDPLHPDAPAELPSSETRFVWIDRRWRAERAAR
jgi:8-oxo-dGTP pyrophosphatase MutT (NUDIX family)